ncbi:TonB family protein [Stakelama pacifica]|uniref:TonB family protein n=1 Tax=Stakelama pacifica TaxID=517720 RepID=A0A4R6FX87_9SPHN|nr:TonB family protein [Stakelama pacifica]TDN86586.1 TonB family protein [Stakelama pacifica]GGO90082.1 hypothetical protein GCM10011329_01560 [Stakelama pacifica]
MMIVMPHAAPSGVPLPPRSAEQRLITYTSGEVRCEGSAVVPVWREPVVPNAGYIGSSRDPDMAPLAIAFRIDAQGRPLAIHPQNATAAARQPNDVTAALAVWRFPAGHSLRGCTVTFVPQAYRPDAAPQIEAMRYAALPNMTGGRGINVWRSFALPDSNCDDVRPTRLTTVYPDFARIDQVPGRLSVSFYRFDVDRRGVPEQVSLMDSTGNEELNRAGAKALKQWRFTKAQAYRGCRYFFWRGRTPQLAAPDLPETLIASAATCPKMGDWTYLPALADYFPPAFNRRGIEGWAVVRFDAAPWGQTGNVEVVASEPASAFGEAAKRLVAQARLPQSDALRVGCVERVRFKMPDREAGGPD